VIYADSNVLIYLIEDKGARGEKIRHRFAAVVDELVVSPLVIMECRVKPLREGDSMTLRRFDRIFETVHHVEIPRPVFAAAAHLRADFGLKTMDAIHLATAQFHLCDGFWTNDARLKAAAGGLVVETF